MPPSLRHLVIFFSPTTGIDKEGSRCLGEIILHDAARHAPLLDHIDVVGSSPASFITYIARFNFLRVLNLTDITQRVTNDAYHHLFRTLSTSEHLVALQLPRSLSAENIPRCSGFAHLETLHIGNKLSTVSRFMSTISHCRLRSLTILLAFADFRAVTDERRMTFEEIWRRWGSSLQRLSLQVTTDLDDDISLIEFLQPIMKLSELESIEFTVPLHASDEAMHEMASVWPKMKSFGMHCSTESFRMKYPKLPTIRCLASFMQLCPDLVTLTIGIDHEGLPDIPDIQFPSLRHGLKNIHLDLNHVHDSRGVARILDTAFPMLEHVVVVVVRVAPGWPSQHIREEVPRFVREFQDLRRGGCLVLPAKCKEVVIDVDWQGAV
jgi:hypothetical protein